MASSNAAGPSGAKESSLTTLISYLESRNIPYFYKLMTKTAVTQLVLRPYAASLGFPASFVREHGSNFCRRVTFQPTNREQRWPIEITVKKKPSRKCRLFAFGPGGWKKFVIDNHIHAGDTLVFVLMEYSAFAIYIIEGDPAEDHEEEGPSRDPSSFPLPCKRCRNVPSQNSGPRFVVNVTPTDVNQLGVPAAFWQCFSDMLPLELKGPNGVIMIVEAVATISEQREQELEVHLESGWKEFFVANDLRIGDLLEFSLVGPDRFLVDVHRL